MPLMPPMPLLSAVALLGPIQVTDILSIVFVFVTKFHSYRINPRSLHHPRWTRATFTMAKGEGYLTTKVEFGSPYQLDKNQVRPAQSLQIPPWLLTPCT
jgi:hypothetical protein